MTIDDPELQPAFEQMGITDPNDKQILLGYFTELFSIAIEHVLKNENQHHD